MPRSTTGLLTYETKQSFHDNVHPVNPLRMFEWKESEAEEEEETEISEACRAAAWRRSGRGGRQHSTQMHIR